VTASPKTAATPSSDELERLKLSPEVAWYLADRGIPLPDCPPKFKTPEPRDVPGAQFDPERVDRVLASFARLRHTKGQWAGQPLKPDPWQVAYILAPVFGWVRWDDEAGDWVRIIVELYVDVPRKNGKSTLSGGIGLYLTAADGEEGAEVLAAATSERQAQFVFKPAKDLVQASPGLSRHLRPLAKRIVHRRTGSYFEVVSKVADAQHGGNIHGAIIDELHIHRDPELVETIETGTGSRRQPLIVIITTADTGRRETIYDRKRRRVEQLARGVIVDESVYGVVWAADETDDPHDEATWKKANPGYGVSPRRAYLVRASRKAEQSPADLASFLRLHLGIRSGADSKYIDLVAWDVNAGMVDEEKLAGREAYGGLDLASTSDLCALAWLFPDDKAGGFDALWRLWTPQENLPALDKRTAGAASRWVKEGLLVATPGNVADYDYIAAAIVADLDRFDVASIGYDPWNASQLTNDLVDEGAPMVKVRQGFQTMSPPLKELQRLVKGGTPEKPLLRHGGNPAVRWQFDNLAVEMDAAGNVKPSKKLSGEKIDAVSAAVTALSEAMTREPEFRSAYEDGDLDVI